MQYCCRQAAICTRSFHSMAQSTCPACTLSDRGKHVSLVFSQATLILPYHMLSQCICTYHMSLYIHCLSPCHDSCHLIESASNSCPSRVDLNILYCYMCHACTAGHHFTCWNYRSDTYQSGHAHAHHHQLICSPGT